MFRQPILEQLAKFATDSPFMPDEAITVNGKPEWPSRGSWVRLRPDNKGKSMMGEILLFGNVKGKPRKEFVRVLFPRDWAQAQMRALSIAFQSDGPHRGLNLNNIIMNVPVRVSKQGQILVVTRPDLEAYGSKVKVWTAWEAVRRRDTNILVPGADSMMGVKQHIRYAIYFYGHGSCVEDIPIKGDFPIFGNVHHRTAVDAVKFIIRHQEVMRVNGLKVKPRVSDENRTLVYSRLYNLFKEIAQERREKFDVPSYFDEPLWWKEYEPKISSQQEFLPSDDEFLPA